MLIPHRGRFPISFPSWDSFSLHKRGALRAPRSSFLTILPRVAFHGYHTAGVAFHGYLPIEVTFHTCPPTGDAFNAPIFQLLTPGVAFNALIFQLQTFEATFNAFNALIFQLGSAPIFR